ncbi:hypothetical protein ACCO45_004452 [Purpureocillium lilacinum]|uniref:Uncharacterized protein n=1 Tax=Purpureocillium lilacinum TaxID=33203 RepID=A0ACC4E2S2_PURLI
MEEAEASAPHSPGRTSSTVTYEGRLDEDQALLDSGSPTWSPKIRDKVTQRSFERTTRQIRCLYWAIAILALLNAGLLGVLVVLLQTGPALESKKLPPWFPPETPIKKIFTYQSIYGSGLSDDAEAAWTDLIPSSRRCIGGKGFVNVGNNSAIDPMPGLDDYYHEPKAMVSVFHQLHCLYMMRVGYYAALDNSTDNVYARHLGHCFDYLRQNIMCTADTTLEWLGKPPLDHGSSGYGFQHHCRDYSAVFAWTEEHRMNDTKRIN